MVQRKTKAVKALEIGRGRGVVIETTKERTAGIPEDVEPSLLALQRAGIVSSPPTPPKPAGSSPALRIACPVCQAPAGAYCFCFKNGRNEVQVIAHKKRREAEKKSR